MTGDLFAGLAVPSVETLAEGAVVLRGFALAEAPGLLEGIAAVTALAPVRRLVTPGGRRMSVAMTNCGPLGWVSDRRGYRYDPADPDSGRTWPPMPPAFRAVATRAATAAGYALLAPSACLINRYEPGARLTLHQDRDELDLSAPIVSVSLGLPATFLFGGLARRDKPRRVRLEHGDVVVWGGASRLAFHGVEPLKDGWHPLTGGVRWNLTFRKVR
jgi:alkylated DNA repair protein (DNA oxidative demethylase)